MYATQGVAMWFVALPIQVSATAGDGLWWVAVAGVAACAWPGVLTVLSPLAMAFFLIVVTGGRRLEKEMAKRPGYPEYQQRTSFFIPRPPR